MDDDRESYASPQDISLHHIFNPNAGLELMETREIQVLLVEDSPEERRLIRLGLSEIEEPSFRIEEAGRLAEAEKRLGKGQTDVVLLDLSLPDSQGLQGLMRLCQGFPSLPIVVFTGLNDQEMALQALREGCQDFLVKGQTEPAELHRVLLHAIERKRVDLTLNNSRESVREAQRLETLGRLAGKIAHDFNNILTTIVGFSDLLLEELQGQPYVDDILEIKKAGERGAALTSSILAFSRREIPTVKPLSINDTVLGLFGMLKQLLPRNINLVLELTPGLPSALANLGHVEQALVNLVVNARDAMPQGGNIKVHTKLEMVDERLAHSVSPIPSGQYITVVVEDDGYGIESSALDRIFEPFFTTKPREAGTGLGLSTVVSIVKGCQGGIEVTSQLHHGTTFSLYFKPATGSSLNPSACNGSPLKSITSDRLETKTSWDTPAEREPEKVEWSLSQDEMTEHLKHLYHVIGHDFHEPLRMVNSYLGLIKHRGKELLTEELSEFLEYAVDGSQRMQGMLDAVLRYSRYLKAPAATEPVPLESIFEKVLVTLSQETPPSISWEGRNPFY